jgi:hypothetical protein
VPGRHPMAPQTRGIDAPRQCAIQAGQGGPRRRRRRARVAPRLTEARAVRLASPGSSRFGHDKPAGSRPSGTGRGRPPARRRALDPRREAGGRNSSAPLAGESRLRANPGRRSRLGGGAWSGAGQTRGAEPTRWPAQRPGLSGRMAWGTLRGMRRAAPPTYPQARPPHCRACGPVSGLSLAVSLWGARPAAARALLQRGLGMTPRIPVPMPSKQGTSSRSPASSR